MTTVTTEAQVAALELHHVAAGYGRTTVLHDIQLSISPGTVAALLGPNGAGKTTLLRVASGLLRPRSGLVKIAGADVTRLAPFKRRQAGLCMIPEGRGVFRALTVRENLLIQVKRSEQAAAFERALAAFPALEKRMSQAARSLSGGEQQMLALARCYLADSSVILVDEVSMGLAPIMVDRVFETLGALRGSGVSLLLVEQYVDRALELADVVYVLNQGQLHYAGTPDEVDREELMRRYLGNDGPQGEEVGGSAAGGTGAVAPAHKGAPRPKPGNPE
jgi:branched-chain amino acid transport system ATP-binding protein